MSRWVGRSAAILACFTAALALAGAAYAHVEVSANPAVAGATNAVVTFHAEAESNTAGVASVRIILPAGIAPADVTLKRAPSGWTLTPTADGYRVGGKALAKGMDAEHSITVARLPLATRLVFKALVNYADGGVDRWIEEPTTANPNPDNPAPVLQLRPAPSPTEPPTAATTAPTITVTTAPPTAGISATTAASTNPDGGNTWPWLVLAAAVLALAAGGAFYVVRRRRAASS